MSLELRGIWTVRSGLLTSDNLILPLVRNVIVGNHYYNYDIIDTGRGATTAAICLTVRINFLGHMLGLDLNCLAQILSGTSLSQHVWRSEVRPALHVDRIVHALLMYLLRLPSQNAQRVGLNIESDGIVLPGDIPRVCSCDRKFTPAREW